MNKEELNTKKAFSLVEVLVSLGILSMLMTSVFMLFNQGNKAGIQSGGQISIQSTARNVMSWLVRDLRTSSTGVIDIELNSTITAVDVGGTVYSLNTTARPFMLTRGGLNIASGVLKVEFINGLNYVDIEVLTYTNDPKIEKNEFLLTGRVKKRN